MTARARGDHWMRGIALASCVCVLRCGSNNLSRISVPSDVASACATRYVPPENATERVHLRVVDRDMARNFDFKAVCVLLDGRVIMASDRMETREVAVTPGTHVLTFYGYWRNKAFEDLGVPAGAYGFLIKSTHELDASRTNEVSVTSFQQSFSAPYQNRPRVEWHDVPTVEH